MKIFHCDHCGHLLFFENVQCVKCAAPLAFLPDLMVVASLDPAPEAGLFTTPIPRAEGTLYRLCANYKEHNTCNFAVAADDPHPLCLSCRLTRIIPDLSKPGHQQAWYKLEVAKRRLVYSLVGLALPVENKDAEPDRGLTFEFLADPEDPTAPKVMTGHSDGVIVLSLAEADDAEREKRRVSLGEPYRTLLGHLRHEVGHYYWDRLVRDDEPRLTAFRAMFGDERQDYGESLARHYKNGPPAEWPSQFVSPYAASHPWEDWAETWAHYLHMADALETAAACGLALRPRRKDDPALKAAPDPVHDATPFDKLMASWYPLTYVLNNLNRGLGLPDGYPFVLPTPAVEKLRFVHETIAAAIPGERGT